MTSKYQQNTEIEAWQDARKYEIGRVLVYLGENPEELPCDYRPGDVVVVVPRNGCGMGIDVRRLSDGIVDMVWPEEVRCAGDARSTRTAPRTAREAQSSR